MQTKRIGTLLAAALIVVVGAVLLARNVGCSQHATDTAETAAPAPVETAPSASTPPAGEEAPATDQAIADTDGGEETAEEDNTPADADKANTLLAQAMAPKSFSDSRWKQGTHYALVKPAQPTATGPDRIEVLEMFWYGCPHCYGLEPYLQNWETRKAPYIQFTRIPATWGAAHQLHARLYYTLLALDRPDLHMVAFREVQVAGNYLLGETVSQTERVQTDFAKRHGIDPAAFKKAYNSDEVISNLRKADELLRRYKVDAVPHVVINGKYWADVSSAGGHSQLITLIDDLAAREHGSKPQKP